MHDTGLSSIICSPFGPRRVCRGTEAKFPFSFGYFLFSLFIPILPPQLQLLPAVV